MARGSGRFIIFAVVMAVVVVLTGAWATSSLFKRIDPLAATRFTVKPRSFSVVLKEKGELQAAKSKDIICEVEGRSTIISLIPEGTAVEEGDLLVELASDKIEDRIRNDELKEANAVTSHEASITELEIQRDKNESDIRKAMLKIELKKLGLDQYLEGDWVQQQKDADVAIAQAEITLERRKKDFEAADELLKKKFITTAEFEEDEFNFQKAEWDVAKAELAQSILLTYKHEAELRQKDSDHKEAIKEAERVRKNAQAEETRRVRSEEGKRKELELIRDQLTKLREQREKCRITAPNPGFVVYGGGGGMRWYGGGNEIKEGAEVYERQVLMQLPDTSKMIVKVRIHEAKTNKLSLGQLVTVQVEGIPGTQFPGKVTKIAVIADSQNRWLNPDLKEYETEITIDPTEVPLKPGVTTHCEILVEQVDNTLAVPVQTVYTKGGRSYVFRKQGSAVEPAEIKLGAIGTEWAAVIEGLSDEDEVLMAFSDMHKRLIPDLPPIRKASGASPSPHGKSHRGGETQHKRRRGGQKRGGQSHSGSS